MKASLMLRRAEVVLYCTEVRMSGFQRANCFGQWSRTSFSKSVPAYLRTSVFYVLEEYKVPELGVHNTRSINKKPSKGGHVTGLFTLPLNYWPLLDSRKWKDTISTCAPITEPTRVQQRVTTSRSQKYAWVTSVIHKARWIDTNVGERLVESRGRDIEVKSKSPHVQMCLKASVLDNLHISFPSQVSKHACAHEFSPTTVSVLRTCVDCSPLTVMESLISTFLLAIAML